MTTSELQALSTPELRALNQRVVALLRLRNTDEQLQAAAEFSVGDTVYFHSRKHGGPITITVTGINGKTIRGVTQSGMTWRVSPSLCTKV